MRNLATILPLKSKLSGKCQLFNAINRSIEMQKNSWISKNIIYWAQTAINEIIQPTPPPTRQKLPTSLLTELNRNMQTFAFQVLGECSSWASGNGAMQMFAGKFVK